MQGCGAGASGGDLVGDVHPLTLQVVKERLGHASISTTERYLHTLPNADETALDALAVMRQGASSRATPLSGPAREAELAELAQLRATIAKVKQLHETLGWPPEDARIRDAPGPPGGEITSHPMLSMQRESITGLRRSMRSGLQAVA